MIPELGHFALIVAFAISIVQSIVPLIGAAKNDSAMISMARPAALVQFLFVGLAYAALTHAFIVYDFSVLYVSNHSNLVQPLMYRISGVWGSHEGSLLLWSLIMLLNSEPNSDFAMFINVFLRSLKHLSSSIPAILLK